METPTTQREKKIAAAESARALIDGLGDIRDLQARATVLHDRVSEGIKSICAQDACFNAKQTETLTTIAVHLALMFDSDLKTPTGFFAKLRHEFSHLSAIGKIGAIGVIVTLLGGAGQIGGSVYHFGMSYFPAVASADQNTQKAEKDAPAPQN